MQRGRRALKYHDDLVCNAVHSAWLAVKARQEREREREGPIDKQQTNRVATCHRAAIDFQDRHASKVIITMIHEEVGLEFNFPSLHDVSHSHYSTHYFL